MIKIHAIIVGRLKSQRLRKKALLKLGAYNLSSFLINRIKNFNYQNCELNFTYATSNLKEDDLLEKELNEHVFIYRGDANNVIKRMLLADKIRNLKSDYFVRITADNPFTCPDHLQKMINCIKYNNYPEYIAIPDLNTGLRCELIKSSYLEKINRKVKNPQNSEYMTFMLNRPDKGYIKYLKPEVPIKKRDICFTVDEFFQYDFVNKIVNLGFSPQDSFLKLFNLVSDLKDICEDKIRANESISSDILDKYNCHWKD